MISGIIITAGEGPEQIARRDFVKTGRLKPQTLDAILNFDKSNGKAFTLLFCHIYYSCIYNEENPVRRANFFTNLDEFFHFLKTEYQIEDAFKRYNLLRQAKVEVVLWGPKGSTTLREFLDVLRNNVITLEQLYTAYVADRDILRKVKTLRHGTDYIELYNKNGVYAGVPLTFEASRILGSSTHWCTVGEVGYWDHYNSSGFMIYVIDFKNFKKYNVHVNWDAKIDMHNDENDEPVGLSQVPVNPNMFSLEKLRDKIIGTMLCHFFNGNFKITESPKGHIVANQGSETVILNMYIPLNFKIARFSGMFEIDGRHYPENLKKSLANLPEEVDILEISGYRDGLLDGWDLRSANLVAIYSATNKEKRFPFPNLDSASVKLYDSALRGFGEGTNVSQLYITGVTGGIPDLKGYKVGTLYITDARVSSLEGAVSYGLNFDKAEVTITDLEEDVYYDFRECHIKNKNMPSSLRYTRMEFYGCLFEERLIIPKNMYRLIIENCIFEKGYEIPVEYFHDPDCSLPGLKPVSD